MDRWIGSHPDYAQALTPFQASGDAPGIFKEMSRVTQTSGIGPMSAVAGAVALKVGENLKKRFGIKEVIVENGGDIYADLCQDMDISVFAGSSPLSEKVGLHIEAAYAPLGICTSSGTVGPSLSFGKADAVMIDSSGRRNAGRHLCNRFRQHDSDSGGCSDLHRKNQGAGRHTGRHCDQRR